jgi:hypothetical protein
LTIAHGFGHTEAETACWYTLANPTSWAVYTIALDVSITYSSRALSAVIAVDVNGGARLTGICDTPNACQASPGFYMFR